MFSINKSLFKIQQLIPLLQSSSDFSRAEYLLQLSLNSSRIKINKLFSINSPHLSVSFESNSQGKETIETWIDLKDLEKSNTIEKICKKGIDVGYKGLEFIHGQFYLEKNEQNLYYFILCKIVIGRPFVSEKILTKSQIPHGFDSLHLVDEKQPDVSLESKKKSRNSSPFKPNPKDVFEKEKVFSNRYRVYDSAYILPVYLAEFEIQEVEESTDQNLCDFCEKKQATVWCENDKAKFCSECDLEYHSSNKLLSRHKRVPITQAETSYGKCPIHPDVEIEFYCPICKISVCVHCKMVGNHSTGEAATHKLIPINSAYQEAIVSSKINDPVLQRRKSTAISNEKLIQKRIEEIENNTKFIKEYLAKLVEQTTNTLDLLTEEKISILKSDQLNLFRQRNEIEWITSFLEKQRTELKPVDFLAAWNQHVKLKQEMHDFSQMKTHIDIENDLKIDGNLQIIQKSRDDTSITLSSPNTTPSPRKSFSKSSIQDLPPFQKTSPTFMNQKESDNFFSKSMIDQIHEGLDFAKSQNNQFDKDPSREKKHSPTKDEKQKKILKGSSGLRKSLFKKAINNEKPKSKKDDKFSFLQKDSEQDSQQTGGDKKGKHKSKHKRRESVAPFTGGENQEKEDGINSFGGQTVGDFSKKEKASNLWKAALKKKQTEKQIETDPTLSLFQNSVNSIPNQEQNQQNFSSIMRSPIQNTPIKPEKTKENPNESIRMGNLDIPSQDANQPKMISMVEEAETNEQKLIEMGIPLKESIFEDSQIIIDPNLAAVLYLCLPFKGQPDTLLLYSSTRDSRSIKKLHELVDHKSPTVFIVKCEGLIFGAFASVALNSDMKPFGSGKSFLFSLSFDTKIPCLRNKNQCLWASETSIRFGETDLIFDNNFQICRSEIENTFGIGWKKGSIEAKTFLAGNSSFIPDIVEVWGFAKSN
ncbi:zinc finger protein constans-like 10 [Anaeramoeba ignava]|uniref:Oxidation resistance protein 1 n=1 Tax=Anaeramoeba ignava TaxID=1746090 RepID=A0A9Q0RH48_ANAIG|nr:zinc finger protein constans-like 10 [Anaeramoeba ignava]